MSDELLEIGTGRRAGPSRRVRLQVIAGVFALALAALVADRELRASEQRAVARCADGVTAAVDLAARPVDAMYGYVRPALDSGPDAVLKDGLYRLVAKSATDADPPLVTASRACSDTTLLPLHDDLQARRDLCVDVVEAQRSALTAVAEDGATVLPWMDAPRRC